MSPSVAADARLRGARSQQVFDALLRSLAEPGTIRSMPQSVSSVPIPAPLWLALALADVDTPVAVTGDGNDDGQGHGEGRYDRLVVEATSAPIVDPGEAWIVVALGELQPLLPRIPVGSALAPEDGARLALPVDALAPGPVLDPPTTSPAQPATTPSPATSHDGLGPARPAAAWASSSRVVLRLAGPGVPGERHLTVWGLAPEVATGLGSASGIFPAGFDTWLFTPDGQVAALSRSTEIHVEPQEAPGGPGRPGAQAPTTRHDADGSERRPEPIPPTDQEARR